jgi:hypothetical protein
LEGEAGCCLVVGGCKLLVAGSGITDIALPKYLLVHQKRSLHYPGKKKYPQKIDWKTAPT